MKIFILNFILLLSTLVHAQSPLSYGEQRSRQDSDPRTLEARRAFQERMSAQFAAEKRRLGLPHLTLYSNPRMVAQRARGAQSAMSVVPEEMKKTLELISYARRKPQALLQQLKSFRTLSALSTSDLERAIQAIAQAQRLNMDYWGYLSKELMLPEYRAKNKALTYYCKWIERESRYELTAHNQRISLIVRGVHASLNAKPWYQFF